MSLPTSELVKDLRLPDGWKKYAHKDVFYNVLTGRETSELPKAGHGVVIYKEGLPALADLSQHLEYFSLQQFEEWIALNEEFISSFDPSSSPSPLSPSCLNHVSQEFDKWKQGSLSQSDRQSEQEEEEEEEERMRREEEMTPWILAEQIKVLFEISDLLIESMGDPGNTAQWKTHFQLSDPDRLTQSIHTQLDSLISLDYSASPGGSVKEMIKEIVAKGDDQKRIIVEMIRGIFKAQVMTMFIPDKCQFARESISILVPFDRNCHKITVNRSKTHPLFCRIIFPAVVGMENNEMVTKALVAK